MFLSKTPFMFLILIFFFSFLFTEEIDFFSEKIKYKNETFYFSKGLFFTSDDKKLSSINGSFSYPLLDLYEDVLLVQEDLTLCADKGMINLETKKADFSSDQGVKIAFNQSEIVSEKIAILPDGKNTIITGNFSGVFFSQEESKSYFSYEGKLVYIPDEKKLLAEENPFYLEDENIKLVAQKAQFFFKEKNGLEKIILSGPVEITSPNLKALSDQIIYLPEKKLYILKSLSKNNVLVMQKNGIMSAKEIHIKKGLKQPEIEAKGIVHFFFSDKEKSYFKHLIEKSDEKKSRN